MNILPSYALCTKCHQIYNPRIFNSKNDKHCFCPKIDCGYKMILVDENLLTIIIELNQKGYTTEYCCSSHLWNGNLYISFINGISIPNPPEKFYIKKYSFKENGLLIDAKYHEAIRINKDEISNFKELSMLERQIKIFEHINILTLWAKNIHHHDLYRKEEL